MQTFRPHDWGSFFNVAALVADGKIRAAFRPHDWGSFFNDGSSLNVGRDCLFVPMIGDLFLIPVVTLINWPEGSTFRPHDWGSFFNNMYSVILLKMLQKLFVPMIGDLFLIWESC